MITDSRKEKVDLAILIRELRSYGGFQRKKCISDLVKILPDPEKMFNWVESAFGEDAARIDPQKKITSGKEGQITSSHVLLTHADGIIEDLVNANPFAAGFSCVLVNLNDIYAAGGIPLYLTAVVNYKTEDAVKTVDLFKGIRKGIEMFDVPLVGGHIAPDCSYNSISMACTGIAARNRFVSASTAELGDQILFAVDLNGQQGKISRYSWDSITGKPKKDILSRKTVIADLAEKELITACKDSSNPGIIGTLAMLLEVSEQGGTVDPELIPYPANSGISFNDWLKVFFSTAYVLTARKKATNAVIADFQGRGMECRVIGEVTDSSKLELVTAAGRATFIDFATESVFSKNR